MAQLVVSEEGEERVLPLHEEEVTIGRAPENTIRLRDRRCSKHHCQIQHTPMGFKLIDLESQNGTLVNGERANQHLLTSGDTIRIGEVELVFEATPRDEGESASRPRLLARRRRRVLPRRRRTLRPATAREATVSESLEDNLKELIAAYVDAGRTEGLEEVSSILEDFYLNHTGSSRVASLVETRDSLMRLQEINQLINSEHNLERLLEVIMDVVIELTSAERGFLILLEQERITFKVARNFDKEAVKNPAFKISHSIAEQVLESGRTILTANAQQDEQFAAFLSVADLKLRSVLCLPLKVQEKLIGCVYMDNRLEEGLFKESHLRSLETFSNQAAIAIRNARLVEELRHSKEKVEELNRLLEEKVARQSAELRQAQDQLEARFSYANLVGRSAPMQELFRLLERLAHSDVPVLIEGESGTGKGLLARAIHYNGPRRKGPFIAEECANISESLLASELFGHARGAFTGADRDRKGLLELAHQGTLFLDAIEEMSNDMQAKLLRALEEGELRPVGASRTVRFDTRLVCASSCSLLRQVKEGRFRKDFYYRINVVTIQLPPLRERLEDIPLLVDHFLARLARENETEPRKICKEALRCMMRYGWPGNVRELENELRRAVALTEEPISADLLKDDIRALRGEEGSAEAVSDLPLKELVRAATERLERDAIERILRRTGWVKTEAARLLGISRPTLDAKLHAYGIERER